MHRCSACQEGPAAWAHKPSHDRHLVLCQLIGAVAPAAAGVQELLKAVVALKQLHKENRKLASNFDNVSAISTSSKR